jgi:carbon monoxide dehydrogenase subunit G
MKISSGTTINQPLAKVWDFINDPQYMKDWQQGYSGTERISGQPLEKGAVAKHTYLERGKPFVMTETIVESNPPNEIDIILEHPTMAFALKTRLQEEGPNATRVSMENEIRFKAFSFKVLKPLLRGPFQKRQDEDLKRLKALLEN